MPLPGVSEIEAAGLRAWPAIDSAADGRWIMRAAGGYTKRANSVQSLDPADDDDVAARLERAVRWYRDRQLPPVFRVTPLAGPGTLAGLAAWTPFDRSLVLAMDLGPASSGAGDAPTLLKPAASEWLTAQRQLQGYDEPTAERLRRIVEQIKAPARGLVSFGEDRQPAASALIVVVSGLSFTLNVVTAEAQRRQGHSRRLLLAAMAWARQAGARRAVIQVLATNAPAIALYESLGYSHVYDYHYRRLGS